MKIRLPSWLSTSLFIIAAVILISIFEYYGLLGIIIFLLAITGYRIYQKRDMFVRGLGDVETMIWGKPLKKELWNKGEMKNTKVVLGFGKSKFFNLRMIGRLVFMALIAISFIMVVRWII